MSYVLQLRLILAASPRKVLTLSQERRLLILFPCQSMALADLVVDLSGDGGKVAVVQDGRYDVARKSFTHIGL